MTEYIDRKEAIKAIESLPNCYNGFSDTYDKACIIGILEELPAAHVQTNADRIRAMTDKELAEFLCCPQSVCPVDDCEECYDDNCQKCVLKWLKKEVKE